MNISTVCSNAFNTYMKGIENLWAVNKLATSVLVISQCAFTILCFNKTILSIVGQDTRENREIKVLFSAGLVVSTITMFVSGLLALNSLKILTPKILLCHSIFFGSLTVKYLLDYKRFSHA